MQKGNRTVNVNLVEENPIIVLDENGGNDPENPELPSTSPETACTITSNTNLVVVSKPQTKALFISRLHTTTTTDNIISYIKERIDPKIIKTEIYFHKFNSATLREIA